MIPGDLKRLDATQTPVRNHRLRRADQVIVHKMRPFQTVDFALMADHRLKLKECEKRDKYLDPVRELQMNNAT